MFLLIDSTLHANADSWGIRFVYKLLIISFEKFENHNSGDYLIICIIGEVAFETDCFDQSS